MEVGLVQDDTMLSIQTRSSFLLPTPGLLDMIPGCKTNLLLMAGSTHL